MRVLVGYASVHGSTAEVAARIADTLRAAGLDVAVADVTTVTDLQGFDACLLGSAIHSGEMLPAMADFFDRFAALLDAMPVYLWLCCLRATEAGGNVHVIQHYIPESLLSLVTGCTVFAGKVDIHELGLNERWVLANLYDGERKPDRLCADYRDWTAIADWAAGIARTLNAGVLNLSA